MTDPNSAEQATSSGVEQSRVEKLRARAEHLQRHLAAAEEELASAQQTDVYSEEENEERKKLIQGLAHRANVAAQQLLEINAEIIETGEQSESV